MVENGRSFHQKHPVVLGVAILAGVFVCTWLGMTFLLPLLPGAGSHNMFKTRTSKVGVVELKGMITSPEKALQELTLFRKDRSIKAIVLRIDSPGGAVGASQEIFEEVKRTALAKPVVASLGSVAASGGYYAALGANEIMASKGTLTGSIGVIIKFANLTGIFEKIGYKSEVLKSGELKDIGASDRQMTPRERELIQGIIDNVHEQFISAVSENRDMSSEEVRKLADGRIYSGEQALDAGLIDKFGNLNDAIMLAASLAGLKEEMPPLAYPAKEDFSLLRFLVGNGGSSLFEGKTDLHPLLSYEWSLSQ